MPLRRKLKTTRFSWRRPTSKVKYWAVTAQQSQERPRVTTELTSEEVLPGRVWKSKKKEAPPKKPRLRSPMKSEGLHCEPLSVPGSLPAALANWRGEGAQAEARFLRVDVCARVHEQLAVGGRRLAHARLYVERREAARHAAVGEAGEGVDGVELVALPPDERAAERRVEEILLPERDGEELVGLARERRLALTECGQHAAHARVLRDLLSRARAALLLPPSLLLAALLLAGLLSGAFLSAALLLLAAPLRAALPRRGLALDALGRAAEEEAVGDAVLDLVGVGDGVHLVEAYDAVEVRDAADLLVGQVRLDDVAEPETPVRVVEVARERGRAQVERELAVGARHVRRQHKARQRVDGVR